MSGSITSYIENSPFYGSITAAEQSAGIPSGLLGAQLYAESTVGVNGAGGNGGGIGQFIPSTAATYGVDTSDDQSGITGAASYLSSLFQSSGSWVSALQSYGTLPSGTINPSSLNAGQLNAYNQAMAADNQNAIGGAMSGVPGVPGSQLTGQSQSTSGAILSSVEKWLGGSAIRILVAIVAIFVLLIGIADLAFGKSPQDLIVAGKDVLKSGVE